MQKRYMHRYMRKPRDMKMRVYRNWVVELNNYYLELFPTAFNATQKVDDDEVRVHSNKNNAGISEPLSVRDLTGRM